jgi:hypothetical protein
MSVRERRVREERREGESESESERRERSEKETYLYWPTSHSSLSSYTRGRRKKISHYK